MANPNPDIYLSPENWISCKVLSGTEEGSSGRPKIVNWAENVSEIRTGTLGYGAYMQKLVFGDPIDKTICPTGQHPNISIFSEIQEFKNTQNNATIATPVNVIEHKAVPCNWFIGEETGLLATQFGMLRDRGNANQRWSPNPANDNGANANVNIAPYTTWAIDGMLLRIEVIPVLEWENIGGIMFPKTSSLQWRTLREWKTNYSSYPICCIGFLFYGQTVKDTNTLGFADNSWIYNDNTSITACPLDDLGDYSGEAFYDYAQCAINRTHGFYLMNSYVTEPYNNTASSAYCYGLNHFDGVQIHAISDSTNGWRHCVEIPYSEKNFETIYKMAACFGMCFSDTNKYTFPADYNDNDLFLPIIDENGISNGEYTHGADNLSNPAAQITDIRSINYDPYSPIPIDPNTYSNVTSFNYITEGAAMTVRYVLDGANVDKLLFDLWTINASIAQGGDFEYFDGKIKDEYLTTNPIDCIVSLIRYPFNIPYQLQPLQSYVKLGKTAGSAKGWTTVYISNQINFQGINIFPRFGDCFLDYEPYTTYELYVPFCGTTKIRAADILGHTLNLTMLIDLITGSCTAYVKADQLVIETLQGSCGVQQQISGTDTATMNANIYNGILAQKQAKAGMIAQGASALLPSNWVNPVSYAAKGEQAEASYKQATYAIEHIETPVHSQGAASPLLGWIQEFNARLMIYYPEGDVITSAIPPSFKKAPLAAFGHLKGFATATPGTVDSFRSNNAAFLSGDIIAGDIPCTLSERNRIKSMFADGVYLPPR